MTTLYDFSAHRADGALEALSAYEGQVILLVNTASECGYTRQYAGLQELQDYFAGQGFHVLGFPCNQFGGQEPGSEEEIVAFCQGRFGVSFTLFAKVEVNGDGAPPLWRWLTQAESTHPHPVKWNFTKFLIDGRGRVVKRYEPAVEPHELVEDIKALLAR
ncbi:glutathione peroxidase [Chromobacterium alticapitis]|uniref:Glutathione peroxidase n=1 Tax=Chromobacterium alticapitis TaxID=2073169 RepID=A0A2S5DHJ2_9NEIS|nr:glutathione peroxidase [Chromobacterium alticapitis]POZ62472.1 glutathione peroxidase [Chromobacterium alticapitis]